MLYTIAEVSDLINLSKVSIYKKLKLKELQPYITKKQGITYIDDVGFNLIKDSLKINNNENNKETDDQENTSSEEESVNINKALLTMLQDELNKKDVIIKELNERLAHEQELHLNTQQLFNAQSNKQDTILLLEEHFKEVDQKLVDIRQEIQERKGQQEQKGILQRIFKK